MDSKSKGRIVSALRKLFMQSELRKDALNQVKSRDLVGNFKNGNPKYLNMYPCAACYSKFKLTEVQVDHISPVVEPSVGFIGWDVYINRLLFCGLENMQVLCKRCHKIKTKREKQ